MSATGDVQKLYTLEQAKRELGRVRCAEVGHIEIAVATYNARCSKCGELTWAHGWNVPAPTHPGPRDPVLEQEC